MTELLPEARDLLQQFAPGAAAKRFVLAFDFDGTLIDIAPTPDSISVPRELPRELAQIARKYPVVICSGRKVADLEAYLGKLPGVDLIGSHGAERLLWRTGESHFEAGRFDRWEKWRARGVAELHEVVRKHGGLLEDKGLSITLHFRESGTAFWDSIEGVKEARERLTMGVRLLAGKACWNFLPEEVNKGGALKAYCRDREISGGIYFGDEPTDEEAFRMGFLIGVRVGEGPTAARYRVPGPSAVRAWLSDPCLKGD